MGIKERKARERERRRQQIMVAAKRVFAKKGFSKSTLNDIAKKAELSPGTIYLYFKSKDELYASLSLRVLEYLLLRVEHINRKPELDGKQKIRALKAAMYDVYEFDPLVLRNICHLQSSDTLENLTPQLLSEIKRLCHSSIESIASIFKTGIMGGEFIDKHPTTIADTLWALFSGIVLWENSKKLINKDKDFLKQTLEVAFDIFERGVIK